jgi:hypothetical protein
LYVEKKQMDLAGIQITVEGDVSPSEQSLEEARGITHLAVPSNRKMTLPPKRQTATNALLLPTASQKQKIILRAEYAQRMVIEDDKEARDALEQLLFAKSMDTEDAQSMFTRWEQKAVTPHPLDPDATGNEAETARHKSKQNGFTVADSIALISECRRSAMLSSNSHSDGSHAHDIVKTSGSSDSPQGANSRDSSSAAHPASPPAEDVIIDYFAHGDASRAQQLRLLLEQMHVSGSDVVSAIRNAHRRPLQCHRLTRFKVVLAAKEEQKRVASRQHCVIRPRHFKLKRRQITFGLQRQDQRSEASDTQPGQTFGTERLEYCATPRDHNQRETTQKRCRGAQIDSAVEQPPWLDHVTSQSRSTNEGSPTTPHHKHVNSSPQGLQRLVARVSASLQRHREQSHGAAASDSQSPLRSPSPRKVHRLSMHL